ncbi:MAG: NADH-quinone oxidoreductase subunit M, partial [Phycisphaerae bacterium]|nr:NADH-quinone oxidoreductase subunit M [Phycisphaerae bacterium]NIU11126.1 NADH-quinone oxidoreductase subunit M [Phycisphaerae bacterium]NIX01233.1 NADH-quinone oxidoreductase subunit M [Phycisphaerae bacterium]
MLAGNLSLVIFFPLIGALILVLLSLVKKDADEQLKIGALVISLIEFVISLPLVCNFRKGFAGIQFEENIPWLSEFGINYHLGIDGISVFLVLLTTFIMPITILSAWNAIHKGLREFLIFMLVLETAMIGTFSALDMILFFVFWEAVLIPMYFLIGIWGTERRVYAAIKFFIYTAFGSALMFVAILYLHKMHMDEFGVATMNIFDFYNLTIPYAGILSVQGLLFLAFFLAFAIKVPMFPFHTWLPDAHVEAPTAGSVILAAILLKMGTYGFVRFLMPLFPEATIDLLPILCSIAVIGIIYGALVAFAQKDLKKLVAYSSVSHLGLVMLGVLVLNIQGVQGGIYQMLNHGLSTGALFLIVGMVYERRHTKKIAEFGGIAKVMPILALFFMLATLSSIGFPLLNGFVGEFLILLGAFKWDWRFSVLGTTGIVLGAIYMLWAYQRVMFGPLNKPENKALRDLSVREIFVLTPIAIMIFVMGIYPKP